MKVSEALDQRKSVRAFVDTPVDNKLIRALLEKSARAASGGNLQPVSYTHLTLPTNREV